MTRSFRVVPLFSTLILLIIAGSALATDGVLEINQTCIVETGCFAGDPAGFALSNRAEGRYLAWPSFTRDGATVFENTSYDNTGDSVSG